ncbi:nucleotide-binding universal stress UspA family protein [Phycicoccus badiiscoriae]|uniref:Nucleotide-binding universal stress UspA family protein n=2 Tax=Pedococcus badiiscoriae TaxID=642776 RepID=A0A852WJF2_9MICO|nr:nucleotide-binding universal stress UspA family protein [Pedococcus badiiscoriae]
MRQAQIQVLVAADYPGMPSPPRNGSWTPRLLQTSAEGHLEEALRFAGKRLPELQVQGRVVVGKAAGVLVEASRTAELLVTGSRSLSPSTSAILGSTSAITAALAHCPVVVARGAADADVSFTRPVSVGVTTSPRSRSSLTFAAQAALRRGVPLNIVGAWAMPAAESWDFAPWHTDSLAAFARALRADTDQAVNHALGVVRGAYPEVDARAEVVEMPPWAALEAASRRAGLLVVGSRGTGGFEGLTLGSVARAILDHSRCPVAVVPK